MLNLQFNFVLNQAMHLAFARADPEPLERALDALPDIPPDAAWANWVRNHDELSLDQLSDSERDEVFSVFGPDPDTRIYGRGLRRRLPSMVEGDERRIRLAYSLMFSLPGTPVLFYGEEIGMAREPRRPRGASRCGRRCSGRRTSTPASRRRAPRSSCARSATTTGRSTSPTSGATRTRCSTGWSG